MDPYSHPGRSIRNVFFYSIIILWMIMLFSCENDMALVNEMTKRDTLPVVSSYNIAVHYSENGIPQFIMEAPVANFYAGEDPRQEFPEGFYVTFFDSLMNKKSELLADYGVSYEKRKLMEARRKVIVINHEKNEKLNTEHMIWDQAEKKIFSDVFVKITTQSDVLYGENGFEAHESFNDWVIRKTSGEFEIEDEKGQNR
ncbi:MAG: LPS export ABC transporter periplasmic protein LptC [Bacteroidales bacterium]|nr:LPS export ABC transporter periplasmic protein LptC [Bacteroidales bacterium]